MNTSADRSPTLRTREPAASSTTALSEFVAGSGERTLDHDIGDLARLHLLDTVASIVACRDLAAATVGRRFALAGSASSDGVIILGTDRRAALADAVMASAMTAHAAETNDFMPAVYVQPGPAVISTALCVAEQRGANADAVLDAVITGYEVAARIPRALGARNLRRAGLASHGVAPTFAAAATAASLLDLDSASIDHVWSACAQQASGSWQWLHDVEHVEKAFVFGGMGARNGVHAALLVEAGYRGVPSCFDHPSGWRLAGPFAGGDADPTALTDGLDRPLALAQAAFKRYPVGGPAQPAVEAMLELVREIDPDSVVAIRIEMPGRADAFADAAMPALNLRYLTALILTDRCLDVTAAQSLERMHADRALVNRMTSVEVVHDPAQETGEGSDRSESARVTLTLTSGARVERFVPYVVGYPTHPMPAETVQRKAVELMQPQIGAARASAVVDLCRTFGGDARVDELVALIAR